MIKKSVLEAAIYNIIKKCVSHVSEDVYVAFKDAFKSESSDISKRAYKNTLKSLKSSMENGNCACADTGWPLFYCKIGNEAIVEGGVLGIEKISKELIERATQKRYLRSTMKHPLTGEDPGNNIGVNIPHFTYKYVPGDSIQITFVSKGGGSECFGGTRYRMIAFADGLIGIEKLIIDWYIEASRSGAICPPGILGIGIGGTSDIAMKIAKEASALRVIGSRYPDKMIAKIESDLYEAINELKVGPMGFGGETSVFAVNVEYAYSQLTGIAVAMNTNCWITRRATVILHSDGTTENTDNPNWFNGR